MCKIIYQPNSVKGQVTILKENMLKTLEYFMTNGLSKGSLLVLIISLYWKIRFFREHTKNPMLMFELSQTSHHPLPVPKMISWDSGGDDVLKIFFYFLYV